MSCVANADAIANDLSVVGSSFCPSAHDQLDKIPSLGFVSDFEYSNGKLSTEFPFNPTLNLSKFSHQIKMELMDCTPWEPA